MPRDNEYFDYEYNDYEFNMRQRKAAPRNNSESRVPPANNPNNQNRYRSLAEQANRNRNDDIKVYRPKGQAPVQSDIPVVPRQSSVPSRYPAATVAQQSDSAKRRKKKGGFRRFLRKLLIFVLVIYFALSAYIYSVVSAVSHSDESCRSNDYISSSSLKNNPFIENILFIGVDSRGEDDSRSDTMILVSIDRLHRKIKLTSFLRDTLVAVPGHGEMKLNAACFYGGPKLVADTIEYNFGIDIDHFMLVDFEAFIQIVDALGGTDVDVTAAEAEYMRTDVKIPWVKEGMNHFNGFVTLWYCRIRYLDSDFNRTDRQRKVISSLLDSAKKQNPFKLVSEVKDALQYIETDMSNLRMTLLLEGMGLMYMWYDMDQQHIPYDNEYEDRIVDEQMVLYINIPETAEKIKKFIYE